MRHELVEYTAENLIARWGYGVYWVMFTKFRAGRYFPKGMARRIELVDPDATQDVPAVPTTTIVPRKDPVVSGALETLVMLRDLSKDETDSRVRMVQVHADAQVAMMRELFGMVVGAQRTQAATPAIDPALTAVLASLAEGQKAIAAAVAKLAEEPDDDDDEDEDELTDDEKVERFLKRYEKEGIAAFTGFLERETVAGAFRLLPRLKKKLPDVVEKFGPLLRGKMDELLAPAPKPKPAPAPAPVVTQVRQTTTQAKPAKVAKANGAAPPAPPPAVKDELTPEVV